MNYKSLSDRELETTLKNKVSEESKIKNQILHLLAEVERRRLYSKECPSLFDYCVRILKYSHSAAQKRIDTMRALKLMPELEVKLESGELNLTTISLAQSFFRSEVKAGKTLSVEDKKKIIQKIENKSAKDTIQEFIKISPESVPLEKRRDLTETKTELKLILESKVIGKLDQLKALLSNKHSHLKDSELIEVMADICLEKLDPVRKSKTNLKTKVKTNVKMNVKTNVKTNGGHEHPTESSPSKVCTESVNSSLAAHTDMPNIESLLLQEVVNAPKVSNQRYISSKMKQEIWRKAQGCCTYVNRVTHERCNSRHFLQVDHAKPLALGGATELDNLRLVCHAHNLRYAINTFGLTKVNSFIRR